MNEGLSAASVALEDGQRLQLAAIFARQRDRWAEVGEGALAEWFAELVAVLSEARAEGRRRSADLEVEFARVLGITGLPAAIVDLEDEAGYPLHPEGWRSAREARDDSARSEVPPLNTES